MNIDGHTHTAVSMKEGLIHYLKVKKSFSKGEGTFQFGDCEISSQISMSAHDPETLYNKYCTIESHFCLFIFTRNYWEIFSHVILLDIPNNLVRNVG